MIVKEDELLSPQQVSTLLGLSMVTVKNHIKKGFIKYKKVGIFYKIRKKDAIDYYAQIYEHTSYKIPPDSILGRLKMSHYLRNKLKRYYEVKGLTLNDVRLSELQDLYNGNKLNKIDLKTKETLLELKLLCERCANQKKLNKKEERLKFIITEFGALNLMFERSPEYATLEGLYGITGVSKAELRLIINHSNIPYHKGNPINKCKWYLIQDVIDALCELKGEEKFTI